MTASQRGTRKTDHDVAAAEVQASDAPRLMFCVHDRATAVILRSFGLLAGTSEPDELQTFQGAVVVVVQPDQDAAGIRAARDMANSVRPLASKVVRLTRTTALDFHAAVNCKGVDNPSTWPAIVEAADLPPWTAKQANVAVLDAAEDEARFNLAPHLKVKRASDLMNRKFAPLKWIIPDLLPEGYAVLAGRPKLGKSFLALDWCIAVAAGGYALGERKCKCRGVLYCGLEDSERRLQSRLQEVGRGQPIPELLDYLAAGDLPRFSQGGLEALEAYLAAHPDVGMVVIDTYARVRPPKPKNADPYQHDYDNGAALADLARRHRVAVLVVLHARKAQAEDFIDEITGTLGIAGAADVILVMRRARGSRDVELHITGKDVPELGLGLRFDPQTKAWTIAGDLATVQQSRETREVLDAMPAGESLKPSQIATTLGLKSDTVTHRLRKMLEQGTPGLEQIGYGKYRYSRSFSSFSHSPQGAQSAQSTERKGEQSEQYEEVIL